MVSLSNPKEEHQETSLRTFSKYVYKEIEKIDPEEWL